MKILAVGDPHCKVSTIGEIRLLQSEVLRVANEHKPNMIVILGDLHNDFEKAHVLAYNAMVDFLKGLSGKFWTIYVIGNHDKVNNSGFLDNDHFFRAMENWDSDYQLTIIDTPRYYCDSDIDGYLRPSKEGGGFVFCPYVPPGQFLEALAEVDSVWLKARAIFCHQEFKGAKMGAVESKNGDEWDTSYPLVISGHIHEYQRLQSNILYIGTPYTTGFGETDRKTISLFTWTEDGMVEERIALNIPRKITYTTSVEVVTTLAFAEKMKEWEGDTVRLAIEGTTAELAAFRKTKKYKELEGKVKIVFRPTDSENQIQSVKRQSYLDLLKEACLKEPDAVQKVFEEVTRV